MPSLSETPIPVKNYLRNIVCFIRGDFSYVPDMKPAALECGHRQLVPCSATQQEPVECGTCKEEAQWEAWRASWPRS